MKIAKYILLIAATFFTARSFAYVPQEGNVTAILGPTYYKSNFGGADKRFHSDWRSGVGLIALGDLNRNGAVEIGIFTLNKEFMKEEGSRYIVQNAEQLQINMGYRYYFTSRLSASVTFFSAYAMGNPETIYSEFAPGAKVDTSAGDKTEYGFDFAGQCEVATVGRFALTVDARYSLSLTPKEGEKADHYMGLIGLRYLILTKSKE